MEQITRCQMPPRGSPTGSFTDLSMALKRAARLERHSCKLTPALPLGTTSLGLTARGGRGAGIQINRGVVCARAGPLALEIRVMDTVDLQGNLKHSQVVLEATHDDVSCPSPPRSPSASNAHFLSLSRTSQPGAPKGSPHYLFRPHNPNVSTTPPTPPHSSTVHPEGAHADDAPHPTAFCGNMPRNWLRSEDTANRSGSPTTPLAYEAEDDDSKSPAGPRHLATYSFPQIRGGQWPTRSGRAYTATQVDSSFPAASPKEKGLRMAYSVPAAPFHLNVRRPFLRISSSLNRQAAHLAVRLDEGAKAARTQVLDAPLTLAGVVGVAGLLQHVMSAAVARAAEAAAASAAHLQDSGRQVQSAGAVVNMAMGGIMHTSGVVESTTHALHSGGVHHAAAVVHSTLAAGHAAGVMMQATGGAMQAFARWGVLHVASRSSSMAGFATSEEGLAVTEDGSQEGSQSDSQAESGSGQPGRQQLSMPDPCASTSSMDAVEVVGSVAEALMSFDGVCDAVSGATQVLGSLTAGLGVGTVATIKGVVEGPPLPSLNQVEDVLHIAGVGMKQAGIATQTVDGPLQAVSGQLRATGKVLLNGAKISEPSTVAAAAKAVLKRTIEQCSQRRVEFDASVR